MLFYLDMKSPEPSLLDAWPRRANRKDYEIVEVEQAPPPCCRNCVFDWAIQYQVPGNLHKMVEGMKISCGR